MSRCPKESLRPLTQHERQALEKIVRSGSERADVVARAREVLVQRHHHVCGRVVFDPDSISGRRQQLW